MDREKARNGEVMIKGKDVLNNVRANIFKVLAFKI